MAETPKDSSIADFLLARIAEDETLVGEGFWRKPFADRMRAECDAKRRIVEVHELARADREDGFGCMHCDWDRDWGLPATGGCDTLRYLAAIYADHLDYREEWKP